MDLLVITPSSISLGVQKEDSGMALRPTGYICLSILIVVVPVFCLAGGPVCPPPVMSQCAPSYCGPNPCAPPPCGPPRGGPQSCGFASGGLGICSNLCGFVISLPAAVMRMLLAPLPGGGSGPRMAAPCPVPASACGQSCQPAPCQPMNYCPPGPCPAPVTKCRPVAPPSACSGGQCMPNMPNRPY